MFRNLGLLMLVQVAVIGAASADISGTARVVDGDTLNIDGTSIRLHGIDAPETAQTCMGPRGGSWACGADAANMLSSLVEGKTVTCTDKGTDKYLRTLGVCRTPELEVNATMVCRGMAWSYREYSHDYDRQEDDAKRRAAGIWRAETQPAWTYRHDAWEHAVNVAPTGKPIVGLWKKRLGEKEVTCIYHAPWSRWYRQATKPGASKRLEWYADEKAATDAGCRAPAWRPSIGSRIKRAAAKVLASPAPSSVACP